MFPSLDRLIKAEAEYRSAIKELQEESPTLLFDIRVHLKLTQRELADRLGVDFSYISKIENGHMKLSRPMLMKLRALVTEADDGTAAQG
jgi:predicted transcriptional regulator